MSDEETSADAESLGETKKNESENIEPADDVVEFEYNDDGEEDLKKTLKKLRADLKACQKEKEEYLTGWQKERADFANYKKGEHDRQLHLKEAAREQVLGRFLSVMDSFNMAFANEEAWNKVDENWRKGVEYIHAQMNSIFEEYGVKTFGAEGETFNPVLHHSIETTPTDKKELDHKISKVIQKGYKMGEDVIRPAGVNVYEFQEKDT